MWTCWSGTSLGKEGILIIGGIGELKWTRRVNFILVLTHALTLLITSSKIAAWNTDDGSIGTCPCFIPYLLQYFLIVTCTSRWKKESSTRHGRTTKKLTSGHFVIYFPIRWLSTTQPITNMQVTPTWDLIHSRTKPQERRARKLQGSKEGDRQQRRFNCPNLQKNYRSQVSPRCQFTSVWESHTARYASQVSRNRK